MPLGRVPSIKFMASSVQIFADPEAGYEFDRWDTNSLCGGQANPATIIIPDFDLTCEAIFVDASKPPKSGGGSTFSVTVSCEDCDTGDLIQDCRIKRRDADNGATIEESRNNDGTYTFNDVPKGNTLFTIKKFTDGYNDQTNWYFNVTQNTQTEACLKSDAATEN